MYEQRGLLISGEWRQARTAATVAVINPADETEIGRIPRAGESDLDEALEAAAAGFRQWRRVAPWERGALLHRVAAMIRDRTDNLAEMMATETGKPVGEARGEIRASADQFEWYGEEARRIFGSSLAGRDPGVRLDVRRQPVGPVAAFSAWNFPALLPSRKIAPALASGCSIIAKPSEEAPGTCMEIAEICREAGLPDGVLNIVVGDPAEISAYLIASPVIRKISLTGSIPVGKHVLRLCADSMTKASLELGGHAPVIVCDDADPVEAGTACARAKFRNGGQVCISPSRFFVHEELYEPFARAMADYARSLRLGPGTDPQVDMGPLINARGRERAQALVEDALNRGADLLCGGRVPPERSSGYFFEPTVLGRTPGDAEVMQSEPFSPVAPIAAFTDLDEVIEHANSLPMGLAAYVFSASLRNANHVSDSLEAGMVGVNDMLLATAEAPFGGMKHSGQGREGGAQGIGEYLETKYVKLRFDD